jgi:hypothetical protein
MKSQRDECLQLITALNEQCHASAWLFVLIESSRVRRYILHSSIGYLGVVRLFVRQLPIWLSSKQLIRGSKVDGRALYRLLKPC